MCVYWNILLFIDILKESKQQEQAYMFFIR